MQSDPEQKKFGKSFGIIAWVCALFLLTLFFNDKLEKDWNPNSEVDHQVVNDVPTVKLTRNRAGHYVANGFINDQPVTFMLDTGATNVAIPQAIADKIGLQRVREFYSQTANGRAISYATRLDSLELGAIVLNDVNASISPGFKSDEILLGMSALKQLEFIQRGNQLTLRQY
ncbi:MAG: aspartyl protease family protein [Phenylobacterium sp.]|jgi:aspartyl protease family protein